MGNISRPVQQGVWFEDYRGAAEESVGTTTTPKALSHSQKIRFNEINEMDHDNLVITLATGQCHVKRVLVDTGSSVNVLILRALQQMGVDETTIVPTTLMLSGFSGETQSPLREVTLVREAKGVKLPTTYDVVYLFSPYNAIVGRPWIHNMKAVSSTLHQVLKFLTQWGIQEIRGD